MTVAIHRLNQSSRNALVAHFLALPPEDRRLRFGSSRSAGSIADYVNGIDFDRDAVFAVHDDPVALVGVVQVAFRDNSAELAISVLPTHRRHGIGGVMFERGAAHARNRSAPRLFMHCLAENAPIMRIARKFGMNVVIKFGDADAHIALIPATPASITR